MRDAVERFPFVLLCGAVGSGCAITAIHSGIDSALAGNCWRLALTVALGLPLFFSLRLLRERATRLTRIPIEWLGVPLLAGRSTPLGSSSLLLGALHFFAAVSAYLRGGESLGFWLFNRHLFLRFCLATLYSAVLTVGFELALFSADKLFELHLDEAYGDLFFLMAGCFHPAFFLAGVPRDFAALQSATDYPRGLKAFTQFALAPLVAVYSAILFAYAAKNSCSPQLAARLGGFAGFDSVRRGNFCRAASPPVGREHGRKMGALVRPQFPARSRYWRSWQDAGTILEALHIRTQNDSNTIALHRTRESPLSLLAIGNLGSSISWTGATLRGGRMSWATSASVWTKIF